MVGFISSYSERDKRLEVPYFSLTLPLFTTFEVKHLLTSLLSLLLYFPFTSHPLLSTELQLSPPTINHPPGDSSAFFSMSALVLPTVAIGPPPLPPPKRELANRPFPRRSCKRQRTKQARKEKVSHDSAAIHPNLSFLFSPFIR